LKNRLLIVNMQRRNSGFTLLEGIIATGIIGAALIVGITLALSNLNAARANANRIIAANLAREGIEVIRNVRDSNWMRRAFNVSKDTASAGIDFYNWSDFIDGWPYINTNNFHSDGCTDVDEDNNPSCNAAYLDIIMANPSTIQVGDHFFWLREEPNNQSIITCPNDATQISCHIQKGVDGSGKTVYFQSTVAPTGDARYTPFYRRVLLKPICYAGGGDEPYSEFDPIEVPETDCVTNPGDELVGVLATSEVLWREGSRITQVVIKERLYNWHE